MPDFTTNWFRGDKIKRWRNTLAYMHDLPGQLTALEIGSFEGRSAHWLTNHFAPRLRLECIDPFTSDIIYERFMKNTAKLREAGLLTIDRTFSTYGLAERLAARKEYDFIYVDGSHEGCSVLFDALVSFRLLKVGRKMCFDDYKWNAGKDTKIHPKQMLDQFLLSHAAFLKVLDKGTQLWIEKTEEINEFMRFGFWPKEHTGK